MVTSNRVTINAPTGYMNLAKSFGFTPEPNNRDVNGYPVVTPSANMGGNPFLPCDAYFGDFNWQFDGRGSMQHSSSMLIRSTNAAGVIAGISGTSGATGGNTTILDKTNPRVVCAFGSQIVAMSAGASNGAGGNYVRITLISSAVDNLPSALIPANRQIKVQGATGQPNAAGIWFYNRIDASTLDLRANVATGLPSVWDGASPWVSGGEVVAGVGAINVTILNQGTFSGFSNIIFCKAANLAAVQAGKIVDPDLVSQFKYLLNPNNVAASDAWIRFMDASGVQSSYECDFSQRVTASEMSYGIFNIRPGYWVNTITRGSNDAYTCSNSPLAISSGLTGAYQDNEVFQGTVDFSNLGLTPTLNVAGRGAAPIFTSGLQSYLFNFSGTLPTAAGQAFVLTCTASWLNGGVPYAFTYPVQKPTTVTGAANNGAGKVRVTVASTAGMVSNGPTYNISGIVGTTEANTGNATTVTVIDATHFDLPNVNFVHAYVSGGTVTPFRGDDTTSFNILRASFADALSYDPVFAAAKIVPGNSGGVFILVRAAAAGLLSISSTSAPAGSICTVGKIPPLSISSNADNSISLGVTFSGTIVTGDVLQLTFNRQDLPGGAYVLQYTTSTTVNGPGGVVDTTLQNLCTNLNALINTDTTLHSYGIDRAGSGNLVNTIAILQGGNGSTPNNGNFWNSMTGGGLTLTFAKISGSGTETAVIGANTKKCCFVYNYLLGGFIFNPGNGGGFTQSVPMEWMVEFCNLVGANLWFCWGTTTGAWVTAVTNYMAANLNPNLKFGAEVGNEVWNSSARPWGQWSALGSCFGWSGNSGENVYSYTGLRAKQYGDISIAAWAAAGRTPSDLYILQPGATFDVTANGNFDRSQMQGRSLNRTGGTLNGIPDNPIYGAYGGLNGSGAISVDYNIFPNRPVDITTTTGCAPYWNNRWLGHDSFTDASQVVGIASDNAAWLQPCLDFANGLTSTAFTAMANLFNRIPVRSISNFAADFVTFSGAGGVFLLEETLVANYDSIRQANGIAKLGIMDYEGGPSWGVGANGNNGVNSLPGPINTVSTSDRDALANRMIALGWDVSPWTVSGTNNRTEMAAMYFAMSQSFKYDITNTGAPANTGAYKNLIKTSYYQARINCSPTREVKCAQYGYGPSNWGLFGFSYGVQPPYTNYDAIHEFNIGSRIMSLFT